MEINHIAQWIALAAVVVVLSGVVQAIALSMISGTLEQIKDTLNAIEMSLRELDDGVDT